MWNVAGFHPFFFGVVRFSQNLKGGGTKDIQNEGRRTGNSLFTGLTYSSSFTFGGMSLRDEDTKDLLQNMGSRNGDGFRRATEEAAILLFNLELQSFFPEVVK